MTDDTILEKRGPFAYENWLAANLEISLESTVEYPLFTDAHIVGDASEGFGPYQLLNTVPNPFTGQSRPTLILRVENHLSDEEFSRLQKNTDDERYHGGQLADEIAALTSLCLGIRLKAGAANREFRADGDPKGRPIAWGGTRDPLMPEFPKFPIVPSLLGKHHLEKITILAKLPKLTPKDAITLVRAARLYQEAVWIVESAPELSWILLTSAVETAAARWSTTQESHLDRLKASQPELENILKEYGGEELVSRVAEIISPYMGATNKFIHFILEFLPDPPEVRPQQEHGQHRWTRTAMRQTMSKIYAYRSRALHGGTPFPAPMCMPALGVPEDGTPAEVPIFERMSTLGGTWTAEDCPMQLHIFEYITRCALLKWWDAMQEIT